MGIANLMTLLISCKDVLQMIDLSTFWEKHDNCKIGVHGSNLICQVRRNCPETLGDGDVAKFELAKQFMSKVFYLERCGFTPYIVFDGDKLPVEKTTSSKGKSQQTNDLPYAMDTHGTVFSLIQTLKRNKIKFVVAPYKADAQLAFLLLKKHVNIILTHEADAILYGCEKIIFEYEDQYYEYHSSRLESSKLFDGFTKDMILQACILGGCDYLSNLPGVSLNLAIGVMKKKKCMEMIFHKDYILEVLDNFKWPKVERVKKLEYIESFRKAMNTYRHQRVYDPTQKTIVCLNDFPGLTKDDEPYIGPLLTSPDIAENIANGSINPVNKYKMKDIPHIEGGYVHSKGNLLGDDELAINLDMERLFTAASTLKVLQEAMFYTAQDQFFTLCRQISKDLKVSKAFQKVEAEYKYNLSGKEEASFGAMTNEKINKARGYKYELDKVIGLVNDLIYNASLQAAQYDAVLYSRKRKEAEMQDDQEKRENLKKELQTSYKAIYKALSSVGQDQTNKTREILVQMCELESLHCKNLAPILESINYILKTRFLTDPDKPLSQGVTGS